MAVVVADLHHDERLQLTYQVGCGAAKAIFTTRADSGCPELCPSCGREQESAWSAVTS